MHVICTAGHVDHGKSTLVRALTGMEPDRYEEERRRGLTLDLGFAWTELDGEGGPTTIAFVDLPGHERFVSTMLAGAGPVATALLVVAADEGWMPQSREHLDILDLLGVRHGVVAVTKSDLVDDDTVDLAAAMVRDELAGSALADVPIVPVSAATGAGLDDLRAALRRLVASAPAAEDRGRPRLWVDRSFSIAGSGTVVTGTLVGGRLRVGDLVEVQPRGARGRVRGLQSLQTPIEEAPPGTRVAVNVAGVERRDAERGDALGLRGQGPATTAVEGWVRVLPGQVVDRKGAWHLHAGSGDWPARVHPVDGRALTSPGYVRVELARPAPLGAGDRFVLRDAGRRATVAGGVVLDADPPPRPRGRTARARRHEALEARRGALEAGDMAELLVQHVRERPCASAARAAAALGLSLDAALEAADARGLVALGEDLVHPDTLATWGQAVATALDAYHAAHPQRRAAPKDVATTALGAAGCPPSSSERALEALVAGGHVVAEGPGVRLPGHSARLGDDERAAVDTLLAALDAAGFSPPRLSEAAEAAGVPPALVRELVSDGRLVRIGEDLALPPAVVEDAVRRLRAAYDADGPLTASHARQVLSTSRRVALPLLEHLDRTGRTRREGDVRVVR